jgi:hypothetical protein
MDRFFAILSEGVHRFEGTINQYTGDGIMALFGAPIAHEDHALRACFAALYLRDAMREYANEVRVRHGITFGVRIGLNSGVLAMVRRSPLGETLGRDRMFFNLAQAVARYCREGRTTRDSHFKNSSTAGSPLSSE